MYGSPWTLGREEPFEPSGIPDELLALSREYRERAEAEALELSDERPPASEARRAELDARVNTWRYVARAAQLAGELGAKGGLVGALEAVLRALASRRRRGTTAARAVFDAVIVHVTALHARAERERRERVRRELLAFEELRRGEEWKGEGWCRDAPGSAY